MKKTKVIIGLIILAIVVSGCTRTKPQEESEEQGQTEFTAESPESPEKPNKLIIFYSLSNNTRFVAEQIQSLTGADIFELQTAEPYPEDYNATLERARNEREAGYLPPLAQGIDNLDDYDIIFIGSPNWFSNLALPVLSFLETHDLSGKTVIPFITFGRGGFQNTVTGLKERLPDAVFLEEFGVTGAEAKNSLSDISKWLENLENLL